MVRQTFNAALLAAAALLMSACADTPTNPPPPAAAPSGAPSQAKTENTASIVAAGSISPPHYPEGSSTPLVSIGSLPDSQWVVIDVQGTVGHAKNNTCENDDALAPAYQWGSWPMDGVAAGPLYGMAKAAVFHPNGSKYQLLPVNGTSTTATHARTLVSPTTSGPVTARHDLSVPSCGDPTQGVYYKGYYLAGNYTITLREVTHPLDLTVPDYLATGTSGQFTAAATSDLRFLNAPGTNPAPAGRLSWYFHPNDTLPETHPTGGPYVSISQCYGLAVCDYTPSVSGRMRVSAYVEGRYVSRKSKVVRVVEPCDTDDPVIDSEEIQTAFTTIWQASNADAEQHSARREQGGWITSDGQGGFDFNEFPQEWERTPCMIDFPDSIAPPAGVVAWVHTHPYTDGDVLKECPPAEINGVPLGPFTYTGDPSFNDDETTKALREVHPHVVGYVVDADGIAKYTGDDTAESVRRYPRCGY